MNRLKLEIRNWTRASPKAMPRRELEIWKEKFRLTAILICLFVFDHPVFPADETNKTPPLAQISAVATSPVPSATQGLTLGKTADKSPEAPGGTETNEVAADSQSADGPRPPALGEASPASPTQRGEQGERDPFSPIGFSPASMSGGASKAAKSVGLEGGKETTGQAPSLSGMLRIGGVIKRGNKFYATINGFTVQAGEVISVVADGEVYQFIVEKIDFNKVQFKPVKK